MNEFTRCNKLTGIYWLKSPIENMKVKLRLKTLDGVALLPNFEDYSRTSNHVNIEELGEKAPEVYNMKWQEKLFSLFEYKQYSDVHNCNTDDEVNYHNILKNNDLEVKKIFTYVHGDYHFPLPYDFKNINMRKSDILNLNSYLEKLQEKYVSRIDSNSMKHLFKSEENMFKEEERWTAMHVMMDYSDYNEDSQLVIKRETRLLSLYHNVSQNYLMITPDVNSLETNPYRVESATGVMLGFEYDVEVAFGEKQYDDMTMLLNKMSKMWHRKHKHILSFVTPSIGVKLYQVNIDLVSAEDFDMDDLYVEFSIKIPDGLKCSNELNGRTHRSGSTPRKKTWHFSHNIELLLEADSLTDPPPIKVFFEVISTDWWGRHRTEGYTCLFLSLTPGGNRRQLFCLRPEEKDSVQAECRRFFVGGCHLLDDLEMLNTPMQDTKYKFVSTGTVDVRWSIVTQCHQSKLGGLHPVTSSSAILQGADAVLRQYSKARARLAAATKYLDT